MKSVNIISPFFIASFIIGANLNLDLSSFNNKNFNRSSSFSQIIGIMVEFQPDTDLNTTGNGQFLQELDIDLIDSENSRCDGFIVDPPPHNRDYFESQIEAVQNYYLYSSNNNFNFNFHVLEDIYQVSMPMKDYSISDDTIGYFFSESLELAKDDIESYLASINIVGYDDVLFVVFHAGVGQDISFPYIDPTNYDIPSAYIESSMLSTVPNSFWSSINEIDRGIILPETLNHIHYDIIEDLFYGIDDYCDYQIGMTGLFSLLIGYALDFPPLYNIDNGRAGVGVFGLMDYGSNNGYGVIPSLPSPWTRINHDWSVTESTSDGQNLLTNNIKRIDISSQEYLLIENRNNWVSDNVDLDSLRNKNKIWSEIYSDSIPGHFFDVLGDNLQGTDQMEIDEETGVILGFDNYDYGLPGSGILVWHINESLIDQNSLSSGINNDADNKAISIKEADGAMDIGFECYHWNPSFCDILTRGWEYDMWYDSNEAYSINNPNENEVVLNDNTNPNLKSSYGASSLLELSNFSELDNSMSFNYNFLVGDHEIEYISDQEIEIIGSGVINGVGCIIYIEDNQSYKKCYNQEPDIVTWSNTGDPVPEGYVTIVYDNQIYIVDPLGFYNEETESLSNICQWLGCCENNSELGFDCGRIFGYFESVSSLGDADEIPALNEVAAGDFDGDGLDEVITVGEASLNIVNNNGTSINNFPIEGNFDNVVLVANILNSSLEKPELILKVNNSINFIDYQGQTIQSITSHNDNDLRLLPNWGDKIALIDGNRLFLFDYDQSNTFWTSRFGTDWNYPKVNPNSVHELSDINHNQIKFYNYPNPVRDNNTTFRFLYNAESMDPIINIYNIEGMLQESILPESHFNNISYRSNEFNEIQADLSDYKAGVYFAELKDGDKSLSVIKVAIIK